MSRLGRSNFALGCTVLLIAALLAVLLSAAYGPGKAPYNNAVASGARHSAAATSIGAPGFHPPGAGLRTGGFDVSLWRLLQRDTPPGDGAGASGESTSESLTQAGAPDSDYAARHSSSRLPSLVARRIRLQI